MILAVDPGPVLSGFMLRDGWKILAQGKATAKEIEEIGMRFEPLPDGVLLIEQVRNYGNGNNTLLRTAEVGARMAGKLAWMGWTPAYVPRADVLRLLDVLHLKGNRDKLVRNVLIDMNGGSRQLAFGTKDNPGPLYGVKADAMQAMGLAVAYERAPEEARQGWKDLASDQWSPNLDEKTEKKRYIRGGGR